MVESPNNLYVHMNSEVERRSGLAYPEGGMM